jgi:hypothetical protein
MTTAAIIKTYPGKRMDVRVIDWNRGIYGFQVQYEFSRGKDQWRNVQAKDGGFHFYDRESALAAARRVSKRNNNW